MLKKFIAILKRLYYGKPKPDVVERIEIGPVEHKLLKPNDVEYRFPELYKAPKVKFRMRRPRTKQKEDPSSP
jgi:hypothetical protein